MLSAAGMRAAPNGQLSCVRAVQFAERERERRPVAISVTQGANVTEQRDCHVKERQARRGRRTQKLTGTPAGRPVAPMLFFSSAPPASDSRQRHADTCAAVPLTAHNRVEGEGGGCQSQIVTREAPSEIRRGFFPKCTRRSASSRDGKRQRRRRREQQQQT